MERSRRCVVDTEQNKDDIQYALRSIHCPGKYIDYYSFVELSGNDKRLLTEQYIEQHPNTKLLVLDNISDYIRGF